MLQPSVQVWSVVKVTYVLFNTIGWSWKYYYTLDKMLKIYNYTNMLIVNICMH